MDNYKELDLFLIGKTGNGKSFTGNSILLREKFRKSATSVIQQEFSQYKDYVLRVVDSPGVCENLCENYAAVKHITYQLNQAMLMNPEGFHAFLIVLKFGNKFTGEEIGTIKFLKEYFGPSFVRDFCILVMSNGDDFAREFEDCGKTFETWRTEQDREMKDLMDECGQRIVLFNNSAIDRKVKEEQLDKLLSLAENLNGGKRYSNKHFEEAKAIRGSLLVKAKESIIQKETDKEASLILQMLKKIQISEDTDFSRLELFKLKDRCGKLLRETELKDKGTKVLSEILDSIKAIKTTIDAEIDFNDRNKREREETRRKHEAEIERMNREFQKCMLESRQEERQLFETQTNELKERIDKEDKERIAREEKWKKEDLEERNKLKKERDEADKKFQVATDKSNESLISKSIEISTNPTKSTADWLASCIQNNY